MSHHIITPLDVENGEKQGWHGEVGRAIAAAGRMDNMALRAMVCNVQHNVHCCWHQALLLEAYIYQVTFDLSKFNCRELVNQADGLRIFLRNTFTGVHGKRQKSSTRIFASGRFVTGVSITKTQS